MAIELPPASYFQQIVDDYVNSDEGRAALGLSPAYTRQELVKIGEQLEHDIYAAFIGTLKSGESEGYQYAPKVTVGISKKTGERTIKLTYGPGALHRPSMEIGERKVSYNVFQTKIGKKWTNVYSPYSYWVGTGEYTGGGINDIFALITSGYSASRAVSGLWRGEYHHALKTRKGTPFIPGVIEKYRAMYPGVTIEYPPEWG